MIHTLEAIELIIFLSKNSSSPSYISYKDLEYFGRKVEEQSFSLRCDIIKESLEVFKNDIQLTETGIILNTNSFSYKKLIQKYTLPKDIERALKNIINEEKNIFC